jgi:hypothetical protein
MGQTIPFMAMLILGVPLALSSGGIILIQLFVVAVISPTIISEAKEIKITPPKLKN